MRSLAYSGGTSVKVFQSLFTAAPSWKYLIHQVLQPHYIHNASLFFPPQVTRASPDRPLGAPGEFPVEKKWTVDKKGGADCIKVREALGEHADKCSEITDMFTSKGHGLC